MAMKVKIIYNGPTADIIRNGMEIARIFYPQSSYVDSPVYTQGHPVDAGDADKDYGKSIYATNVDGWGHLPGLLPMANTTTKFAQFERAVAEAAAAKAEGKDPEGIEFEVEGYEEEIYWDQMGKNLADQGFEVTIENGGSGE